MFFLTLKSMFQYGRPVSDAIASVPVIDAQNRVAIAGESLGGILEYVYRQPSSAYAV